MLDKNNEELRLSIEKKRPRKERKESDTERKKSPTETVKSDGSGVEGQVSSPAELRNEPGQISITIPNASQNISIAPHPFKTINLGNFSNSSSQNLVMTPVERNGSKFLARSLPFLISKSKISQLLNHELTIFPIEVKLNNIA